MSAIGNIDLLKTLYWYFRLKLPRIGCLCIFPKSIVRIDKTAVVDLNNANMNVNASWVKGRARRNIAELTLSKDCKFSVDGNFSMYQGACIHVAEGAELKIGSHSFINTNTVINCFEKIEIGSDVAISDNVSITDSDSHSVVVGGEVRNNTSPVKIEDHVWIGKNAVILKGVTIGRDSVVAAGAVITKSIPSGVLVGGNHAKILIENVNWK